MNTTRQLILFTVGACLLFTLACKKDKTTKTGVPELTTLEVTNILATTAMSGGDITSNGGETVVASGICWSKTNHSPTISDDTTKSITSNGSFSTMLKNLSPSATYYARAYATNRIGTGYGNVITFSTGNAAPVATAVSISGDAKVNSLLTGNYTYTDSEGDSELGTSFQWYAANDASGAGEAAIVGATGKTFHINEAQQGKYIRFGVSPKSSAGNPIGNEAKSTFIGAVGEATTVTFTYNGTVVTYGIIIGPSGKKWLDRNLGASRVAQSIDDYQAYGDLFQWGRPSDGHQLISRGATSSTGVTGITTTTYPYETSESNTPVTNKYIINKSVLSLVGDWRIPQENNLWQGVNGINNPCPTGWRIPTKNEWLAEGISLQEDAYTKLKLTKGGWRDVTKGTIENAAIAGTINNSQIGYYWTSTSFNDDDPSFYSVSIYLNDTKVAATYNYRGNGYSCRCIRN